MRLNLGSGDNKLEGYDNLDVKFGNSIYPLDDYEDGSVDEIRASHVLEHFPRKEIVDILKNWVAKLQPNGVLKLAVPNLEWIMDEWKKASVRRSTLTAYMMGGQTDEHDYHKSAFDHNTLWHLMRSCGLYRIGPWKSDHEDCAKLPVSLNLQGSKLERPKEITIPPMFGAVSTSRVGFTPNWMCLASLVFPKCVDVTTVTGAYWHKSIEAAFENSMERGAKWIIVCDWDSVFHEYDVRELIWVLHTYDEVDAVQAFQFKRSEHTLMSFVEDLDKRNELTLETMDKSDYFLHDTGHFGLTIIDTEIIKRMPKPWFTNNVNAKGETVPGCTDFDVGFWHQFKLAGGKLATATRAAVGHMELMITWPDYALQPTTQLLSDYYTKGKPSDVRR